MPSKTSRPLGFAPSTSGNLVPSLATDSALTYAEFPTSSFFEIGPLCCAQAPEAPNNINTAKAAVIDLFMVSPSPDSLYPLSHPRHEALHPARHAREVAAFHYLHHFLHLLELVEQAIDFLHRYARARGDAALARGLEDFRPHPLCGSHGVDDAFDAAQLLFVHLRGLRRLGELRRELLDQGRHPAHLAHLADLLLEVLQIEALALFYLLGEFSRLPGIDRLSRLLDER